MPTILPANAAICAATMTLSGSTRPQIITFAFSVGGPTTAAAINTAFLAGLRGGVASPLRAAVMSNLMTFAESHVLYNDGSNLFSDTATVNVTGSSASSCVPPNVAGLVTKATLFAGPKFRGRIFMPSGLIFEANVDEQGIIAPAQVTTYTTAWAAAFTAWTTGSPTLAPIIIHRDGSGSALVTSFKIPTKVATMRRRLRK